MQYTRPITVVARAQYNGSLDVEVDTSHTPAT
jgi:hypothetical protein